MRQFVVVSIAIRSDLPGRHLDDFRSGREDADSASLAVGLEDDGLMSTEQRWLLHPIVNEEGLPVPLRDKELAELAELDEHEAHGATVAWSRRPRRGRAVAV